MHPDRPAGFCSSENRPTVLQCQRAGNGQFLAFRAGPRSPPAGRNGSLKWKNIRQDQSGSILTLTHVDDVSDTSMREKIGADTSKTLRFLGQHDFTFLIEDPAPSGILGPQRYPQIAARYQALTPRTRKTRDRYQHREGSGRISHQAADRFRAVRGCYIWLRRRSRAWPSTSRTRSFARTCRCSHPAASAVQRAETIAG